MSGVWERLVRTVKRSLKAILGKEPMNEEVLSTVFTEAERIVNTKPLTPNSSCPGESEPLTPKPLPEFASFYEYTTRCG